MKNLNLENYGVQEMNEMEMMNVNGGTDPITWLIIGLAAGELLQGFKWSVAETHTRSTLLDMYQVDVKLWN